MEYSSCRIRMIDNSLTTIIGTGSCALTSTSTQIITSTTKMSSAYALWVNSNGIIYFPEYSAAYVRSITPIRTQSPSMSP
mmetsp:Transcript_17050/g.18481  ORF Transcript_17050/g.18481 Transcript_17050/m.18481 type:complete len:80 (+) Transcript_17050:512-751(+)